MPGGIVKKSTAESILTSVGWLSKQPHDFQFEILKRGHLVSFEVDQYIYRAEDLPGGVYGIADGAVAGFMPTRYSPPRLVSILRVGNWFGERPLLSGIDRLLSFRAAEPCTLMRVELSSVNELVALNPLSLRCFASISEAAFDISMAVIHDLMIADTNKRIAATMLRVAGANADPASCRMRKIRLNQSELADMSNTSRHSTNRALQSFEASGWIGISYRHIQLYEPIAIADYAYSSAD